MHVVGSYEALHSETFRVRGLGPTRRTVASITSIVRGVVPLIGMRIVVPYLSEAWAGVVISATVLACLFWLMEDADTRVHLDARGIRTDARFLGSWDDIEDLRSTGAGQLSFRVGETTHRWWFFSGAERDHAKAKSEFFLRRGGSGSTEDVPSVLRSVRMGAASR